MGRGGGEGSLCFLQFSRVLCSPSELSALYENKPPSDRSASERGKAPLAWDDVSFLDHRTARQYIERICSKLSPLLTAALPALFSESPDPDSALILFDQLVCDSPEIAGLLDRYHYLAHYALIVFGHSRYLGDTLIQNTDLLQSFVAGEKS